MVARKYGHIVPRGAWNAGRSALGPISGKIIIMTPLNPTPHLQAPHTSHPTPAGAPAPSHGRLVSSAFPTEPPGRSRQRLGAKGGVKSEGVGILFHGSIPLFLISHLSHPALNLPGSTLGPLLPVRCLLLELGNPPLQLGTVLRQLSDALLQSLGMDLSLAWDVARGFRRLGVHNQA